MKINTLTEVVIGSAIEVHRRLGPGLLESAYQECMARELSIRGVPFAREQPLPLNYKGLKLSCGYRLDFLVANELVLELKAVDSLQPVHVAQLLTYLRLGGWKIGLLINFHAAQIKEGIRRVVLGLKES